MLNIYAWQNGQYTAIRVALQCIAPVVPFSKVNQSNSIL